MDQSRASELKTIQASLRMNLFRGDKHKHSRALGRSIPFKGAMLPAGDMYTYSISCAQLLDNGIGPRPYRWKVSQGVSVLHARRTSSGSPEIIFLMNLVKPILRTPLLT